MQALRLTHGADVYTTSGLSLVWECRRTSFEIVEGSLPISLAIIEKLRGDYK